MNNGLINLFAVIIVIGVIIGLVNRFIPMAGVIKSILNFLAALVSFIYILQFFHVIQNVLPIIQIIR